MSDTTVYLLVIGAAFGHAAWNAIGFAIPDKYTGLLVMNGVLGVCGAAMYASSPGLKSEVLPYLVVSAALHCAYQVALVKAYTVGGFLQVYPISRGMVPLVVTGTGLVLGQVTLSVEGAVGLALVCLGLICAAIPPDRRYRTADGRAAGAAVAVGVLVAGYTLADGFTVTIAQNTLGSLGLIYLVQSLVFSVVVLATRVPTVADLRAVLPSGIAGGLISALVFGVVFWAQSRVPTFIVSTLRETSIVFGFVLGVLMFREKLTRLRVLSLIMVLGGGILLDLTMY